MTTQEETTAYGSAAATMTYLIVVPLGVQDFAGPVLIGVCILFAGLIEYPAKARRRYLSAFIALWTIALGSSSILSELAYTAQTGGAAVASAEAQQQPTPKPTRAIRPISPWGRP